MEPLSPITSLDGVRPATGRRGGDQHVTDTRRAALTPPNDARRTTRPELVTAIGGVAVGGSRVAPPAATSGEHKPRARACTPAGTGARAGSSGPRLQLETSSSSQLMLIAHGHRLLTLSVAPPAATSGEHKPRAETHSSPPSVARQSSPLLRPRTTHVLPAFLLKEHAATRQRLTHGISARGGARACFMS